MALWDVNLPEWLGSNFKEIQPESVLVEYDGPLTFTFRDAGGNLMLAHLSDECDGVTRYIAVAVTDRDVERLIRGTVSLRGVLNQPLTWVLDLQEANVIKSWAGNFADIPDDVVPTPDAMLYPGQEPIFAAG